MLQPAGRFARALSALPSRLTLAPADTALADLLIAELRELAAERPPRVVSVDLFDTLLLRNNKCESRRFWEISRAIRERLGAESQRPASTADLFVARYLAMRAGYRGGASVKGCVEGDILPVLATQLELLALPQSLAPLLLETELRYEARNLKSNHFLLAAIRRAFGRTPLVCLSDMYLGGAQLDVLLRQSFGPDFELHGLFSSADIVVNKRSGQAYPFVAQEMGVDSADFLHIGDRVEADLVQARRNGWRALLFPVTHAELAARSGDLEAFLAERRQEGFDADAYATL